MLWGSGCASIISGSTQSLFVNTNPSGATVKVDGLTATTPTKLELQRNQSTHDVRIEKAGYEPVHLSVGRKINPWVAGNLLWGYGFAIGVIVDFVSGGAWGLEKDDLDVSLAPKEG